MNVSTKPVAMQSSLRALDAARQQAGVAGAGSVQGGSFGTALKQALDNVSGAQNQASTLAKEFQLGNPDVSLEETMIAAQKASITFQAAVQVRSRLVAVYNEIMQMNV